MGFAHTATCAAEACGSWRGMAVLAEALEVERDRLAHPLLGPLAGGPRRDATRRLGECVESVPPAFSMTTRYRGIISSHSSCQCLGSVHGPGSEVVGSMAGNGDPAGLGLCQIDKCEGRGEIFPYFALNSI